MGFTKKSRTPKHPNRNERTTDFRGFRGGIRVCRICCCAIRMSVNQIHWNLAYYVPCHPCI